MDNSFLYVLPLLTNLLSFEGDWSWRKLVPLLLSCLLPLCMEGPRVLSQWRAWFRDCFSDLRGSRLQFVARQQIRRWFDNPDSIIRNFSTVMWDWNSRNEIEGVLHLSEEANANGRFYDDEIVDLSNRNSPLFVDNPDKPFWRRSHPNIRYTMWVDRATDREGGNISEIILKMEFIGLTPKDMVEHIDWLRSESTRISEQRKKKQRVLVTSGDSEEKEKEEAQFMTYEFHTTSSFSNFFCEEAETVKRDLDHFLNDRTEYERIGRPWTYTVVNSGPPGVGKTKLVKSLAAYTGYTVIVINLHHIANMKMLYNIFHNSVLAGEKIPHEKRLYYIPEVDTQVHEILQDRSTSTTTTLPTVKMEDAKSEKGLLAISTVSKKPTLGEILNVLDGVPERHGHILVFDTNRLDSLDKALIRPGRADRILRWKPMSEPYLRKYLEHNYKSEVPSNAKLADGEFTAAEVGAIIGEETTLDGAVLRLRPRLALRGRRKN